MPSAPRPMLYEHSGFVDTNDLRTSFALAMSGMYKTEVPLYGNLMQIVRTVNEETLRNSSDPAITSLRNGDVASERLDLERHGAIRLGTPHELQTVRRIFSLIGMYPVGYYDLSEAGLPMHATCFRPTDPAALKKNPFRVFTTLLRPELVQDTTSRVLALDLLNKRNIFSPGLMHMLDVADRQGGHLTSVQADTFVQETMKTFGWSSVAAASKETYEQLKREHPILADIACFQSSHINHLTPRTLDISAAQDRMKAGGLNVKDRIEGPPPRDCPILLRQTSFLALEERIMFPLSNGELEEGSHKARFGEIEERGAAATKRGRELYDSLLNEAMEKISKDPGTHSTQQQEKTLARVFSKYPDTWEELRKQGLVHFHYRCWSSNGVKKAIPGYALEDYLRENMIEAVPITYEDFLPLSAAGIFQSNLQTGKRTTGRTLVAQPDLLGYEKALGCPIMDLDAVYTKAEQGSLRQCARELKLDEGTFLRV